MKPSINVRLSHLIISLLIFLPGLLLVTGCEFFPMRKSPEELTRESEQADPMVRQVQILGSRTWPGGAIVLYLTERGNSGQSSPVRMFGFEVHPTPKGNISLTSGSSSEEGAIMPNSAFLCHGVVLGRYYSIVYGRAKMPDVTAVEADFANGKTSRDETANGVYAVIQPAGTIPTSVRALDSNDQVLYKSSLPATDGLSVPSSANASVSTPLTCGP